MMPAATNLTISSAKATEGAPAPVPGAAELFAALVAGVTPGGGEASSEQSEMESDASDAPEAQPGSEATSADAATLLPLIEQQRAAQPSSATPPHIGLVTSESSAAASGAGRGSLIGQARSAGRAEADPTVGARADAVRPQASASAPGVEAAPARKAGVGEQASAPKPVIGQPSSQAIDGKPAQGAPMTVAPVGTAGEDGVATSARPVATEAGSDGTNPARPSPDLRIARSAPANGTPAPQMVAPGADAAQPGQPVAASQPGVVPAGAVPAAVLPAVAQIVPQAVLAPEQERATAKPTRVGPVSGKAVVEAPTVGSSAADPARTLAPVPVAASARITENTDIKVPVEAAGGDKAASVADRTAAAALSMAGPAPVLSAPSAAAAPPPAAPGAALAQQMLDMTGDSAWIDTLARDISKVTSADGTMRFRLAPETLGELRVEITQSERGALIRMQVTSEAAQQALADAQPRLAAEARAQGARIAETEISFTGGQAEQREAGRQAQSQPQTQAEQAQRAFRGGGSAARSSMSDQAAPEGRRQDRYA